MHLHTDLDVDTTPSTLINITTATSAAKPTTTATTTLTELTSTTPSPPPTTKPLYFAYGSNLSPTQMATRCTALPSSIPLAIARLPKWRWLIHERGYANVVPPSEMCITKQQADCISSGEVGVAGGADEDAVYGVLYDMGDDDEKILDGFEGVDYSAPDAEVINMEDGRMMVREKEQGHGCYNKWVVEAEVVKWLGEKDGDKAETVPVLVYVDEKRVRNGPPKAEYVPRMNRAIRESVALGLPAKWAEEVMRPAIPLN